MSGSGSLIERLQAVTRQLVLIADQLAQTAEQRTPLPLVCWSPQPDSASVLRFRLHLAEHGCDRSSGFGYCDEAMRLFNDMPDDARWVIGGRALGEEIAATEEHVTHWHRLSRGSA